MDIASTVQSENIRMNTCKVIYVSEIVLGFVFSVWGFVWSILSLEAAISTVFAAFWTSNVSLSIVFASFQEICSILALEAGTSAVLILTWCSLIF